MKSINLYNRKYVVWLYSTPSPYAFSNRLNFVTESRLVDMVISNGVAVSVNFGFKYGLGPILVARSPGRLIFVLWRLIYVGRQDGMCFISPFWRLEFCGRPLILVKLCTRALGDV